MYKVVFHLDEEGRVGIAYRGIMNLLKDMEDEGEQVEIELLANSSGVNPFMKDKEENSEAIGLMLEKGVKIALCNNTLRVLYKTKEDFIEEAIVVKSGVGELTRKQRDGWSYIKP